MASFAPQTEHFPSEVILGCSLTSAPHRPHLGMKSPPTFNVQTNQNIFLNCNHYLKFSISPPKIHFSNKIN
jgi:hypothetical protein